jgi:hypothetical protein
MWGCAVSRYELEQFTNNNNAIIHMSYVTILYSIYLWVVRFSAGHYCIRSIIKIIRKAWLRLQLYYNNIPGSATRNCTVQ